MTKICIINPGSGNIRSLQRAFVQVGCTVTVSNQPDDLKNADRLVLPGQGAYGDCMRGIEPIKDLFNHLVLNEKKPYLGICVGMHVMTSEGHENQVTKGLNWVGGQTVRLKQPAVQPGGKKLTIPHMGWNQLVWKGRHPIIEECPQNMHVYFAHSYIVEQVKAQQLATCQYGSNFPVVLLWRNCLATQFHPEKSQASGLRFLRAFAKWQP